MHRGFLAHFQTSNSFILLIPRAQSFVHSLYLCIPLFFIVYLSIFLNIQSNSSSTIFCPLPLSLYSYFFYCLFEYISSHPLKILCSSILHLFFSPPTYRLVSLFILVTSPIFPSLAFHRFFLFLTLSCSSKINTVLCP